MNWADYFSERRVKPDGECVIWTRYKTARGYGKTRYQKRYIDAHRLSWIIANGRAMPRPLPAQ